MTRVIVLILILVLTLSLFGIAVLGQASGARELAERGTIEQNKVTMMLQDSKVVTGNTVKSYLEQKALKVSVQFIGEGDFTKASNEEVKNNEKERVFDGAMFKMEKTYNANGQLETIVFSQVDLGKEE